MTQKHIILHRPVRLPVTSGPAEFRTFRAGGSLDQAEAPEAPRVELDEMRSAKAAGVARRADVLAVAPVIPMKLIAPLNTSPSVMPAGATAWGIEATGASSSQWTGFGITVAVLDTGIDPDHPAFSGVELVCRNFTAESDDDVNGHGTHCAGTIFGRDVGGVRIGVARGVGRALIGKVIGRGGGGSDNIVEAIQWAVTNGANVISMSLGIDFPGYVTQLQQRGLPTELATSRALEGYRANVLLFERLASLISAQGAFGRAALLIAAAGNESRRDVNLDFEIAASPPAVADGIVSVAAVGQTPSGFKVATFSNTGARVAGPGIDIDSAQLGGGLQKMSGTSMATPHVAGVAALWAESLASQGRLNAHILSNRLVGTATTHGMAPGFDPDDVGAGVVQAPGN